MTQALLSEWDHETTIAQAFGEGERMLVQIGQRDAGWFSDEPRQALTLDIEAIGDGVQVTMGQQQWYKQNDVQIFTGGLIGFLPFFFTFPLGELFGGQEGIDQRLPALIWQSIERHTAGSGAATGRTQRLATLPCPACGVANPQGAERCSACGTQLTGVPGCSQCGQINPPGSSYCNRCGTQLA